MTTIFSFSFSALALVLSLAGCASLNPPPEFTETHCGKTVLMLPDRIEACPAGSSGCAWEVGVDAWAITYPPNSASVKEHEIEHVCGMSHRQPWVPVGLLRVCTEVTQAGSTAWIPGQVMCRFAGGDIFLEKNPSVIERVRKLHTQKVDIPTNTKSDY